MYRDTDSLIFIHRSIVEYLESDSSFDIVMLIKTNDRAVKNDF